MCLLGFFFSVSEWETFTSIQAFKGHSARASHFPLSVLDVFGRFVMSATISQTSILVKGREGGHTCAMGLAPPFC